MQINTFEKEMLLRNPHIFRPLRAAAYEKADLIKGQAPSIFEDQEGVSLKEMSLDIHHLNQLFYDLLNAITTCENLLLRPHQLLLRPEVTFYNSDLSSFLFCYLPTNNPPLENKAPSLIKYYESVVGYSLDTNIPVFKVFLMKEAAQIMDALLYMDFCKLLTTLDLEDPGAIRHFICFLEGISSKNPQIPPVKSKKTEKTRTKKKIFFKKYGIISLVKKNTHTSTGESNEK